MHGNVAGLIYSVLLIAFFYGASYLFKRLYKFSNKDVIARKILHIGVSNWYFVYSAYFTSAFFPVAGLVAFAGLNFYLAYKDKTKAWGTVEYPLVIALLVVLVELGYGTKEALGCALLGMGYGDGLAAILGLALGSKKIPGLSKKTVVGSTVCFIAVTVSVALLSGLSIFKSILIGILATVVEAYTPFNLDNITVPITIFGFVRLLC